MRLIDAVTLKAEFTGNFQDSYPKPEIHALIDLAPTIGGWISVKDRLPDADGDYLVFGQSWYGGQSMAVSIANYVRDISDTGFSDQHRPAWVSIFDWDEFDITHWMPLPDPPKEETDD